MSTSKEDPLLLIAVKNKKSSPVPRPKRRWLTRLLLPAGLLAAVLLLFAWASRDALWPAEPVLIFRAVS